MEGGLVLEWKNEHLRKGVLNSLVILEAVLAHQKQFVNFWMSQVTFVPLVRALVTIFTGLNVVASYTPLLPRTVS